MCSFVHARLFFYSRIKTRQLIAVSVRCCAVFLNYKETAHFRKTASFCVGPLTTIIVKALHWEQHLIHITNLIALCS